MKPTVSPLTGPLRAWPPPKLRVVPASPVKLPVLLPPLRRVRVPARTWTPLAAAVLLLKPVSIWAVPAPTLVRVLLLRLLKVAPLKRRNRLPALVSMVRAPLLVGLLGSPLSKTAEAPVKMLLADQVAVPSLTRVWLTRVLSAPSMVR